MAGRLGTARAWFATRRGRWVFLVAALLVPLVALAAALLSGAAAPLVLRLGLGALHGTFDGRFEVRELRSGNLLREVRLVGVRITDLEGRPALEVDSLAARFRIGDLLRKRIRLHDVDVWGATVNVERMPGQSRVNLERIFVPNGRGDGGGEGSNLEVTLRSIRLHGANLTVRNSAATRLTASSSARSVALSRGARVPGSLGSIGSEPTASMRRTSPSESRPGPTPTPFRRSWSGPPAVHSYSAWTSLESTRRWPKRASRARACLARKPM